jgi:hypothetical protein
VNSDVRRARIGRGLGTGAVGRWLFAQRGVVRAVIALVAIAGLFALRPLSASEVALVTVVALLTWWITELLQTRPDEA